MRILVHAVWGVVIFLVLMGLTTLVIASVLDAAVSPEQLGYMVGRKIFWLLGGTGLILFVCSRRAWLPGLQQSGPAAYQFIQPEAASRLRLTQALGATGGIWRST